MVAYIDAHKDRFGVEPICAVLPIAPSTYYQSKTRHRDPDRRSARAKRDDGLKHEIQPELCTLQSQTQYVVVVIPDHDFYTLCHCRQLECNR